ncbi:hypothetical protein BT67DRAFT_385494 [Trichocladium antarcticum]|uniref:Uncharacterized protein n=1 Tax=Trichocladium antarcticum TaxID=1450529 RepID=A0AAN6UGL6_9PEZI|nr:hypothetical protein BT67DRAFT_385494 [Trichocladium antarcticum]
MDGHDFFPELHCDGQGDIHLLQPRGRDFLPKTPVPDFEPSMPSTRYPNWTTDSTASSGESTPDRDYESSRPSTARSTQTSASSFSRFSHISDEDRCDDFGDESKDNGHFVPRQDAGSQHTTDLQGNARKAPWTRAMSDHLWSTFVLYLQDPKVTPIRMGKSSIPPHGVCLRVAREAKRSWKGSKALARAGNPGAGNKSGSATPTAGTSSTFIQWPHTCAATRAHLRELCKLKASSRANNCRFMSQATTPFTQAAARHWNRRCSPAPFATQDMSKSLALSTSKSMLPTGPLAQLAMSKPENAERGPSPILAPKGLGAFEGEPSFAERRRLGSPFSAGSYGPSSSGSLAAPLGLSGTMPRRLSNTVGARRTLQSPVRLSRSGTQKRRHTQSSVPRMRPSINSDLWLDPTFGAASADANVTREAHSSNTANRADGFFIPAIPPAPTLLSSASMPNVETPVVAAGRSPPPRLGSPFPGSNSSYSFPHRAHRGHQSGSIDLGVLGRPFATVQQFSTTSGAAPSRNTLADRLAYIDQRLKEFRKLEPAGRRESPL